MIVWSGWGILVIPIVIVVFLVITPVAQAVLTALGHPDLEPVSASLALLAAAAAVWWIGRALNRRPGRELIDKATGRTVVLRRRHRLFWINMEYWAIPLVLMAVLALLPLAGVHVPMDESPQAPAVRT